MNDTLDEGMIPAKITRFAKRAIIMFGLSILTFTLTVAVSIGLDNENQPYDDTAILIIGLLSFTALFVSVFGTILSIKAFYDPKEKGVIKYLVLIGNGLLSLLFGLYFLGIIMDVYRDLL